jgi:hypothetical protein
MALTHLLTCPFCQLTLSESGNTFVCANNHTFDIAREGYVNLLRKKQLGDTKEMLVARRQFLEQGYYQPLSDQLNELIYAHLSSSALRVLDAGCGEGYYLGCLQRFLVQKQPAMQEIYLTEQFRWDLFIVSAVAHSRPFYGHDKSVPAAAFREWVPAEFLYRCRYI